MIPGIPGRHGGSRLPSIPLLHRSAHTSHAAIALAGCGAGLALGTAAGAMMARSRHRAPGAEEALTAAEAE
jgi:hypothetical protein